MQPISIVQHRISFDRFEYWQNDSNFEITKEQRYLSEREHNQIKESQFLKNPPEFHALDEKDRERCLSIHNSLLFSLPRDGYYYNLHAEIRYYINLTDQIIEQLNNFKYTDEDNLLNNFTYFTQVYFEIRYKIKGEYNIQYIKDEHERYLSNFQQIYSKYHAIYFCSTSCSTIDNYIDYIRATFSSNVQHIEDLDILNLYEEFIIFNQQYNLVKDELLNMSRNGEVHIYELERYLMGFQEICSDLDLICNNHDNNQTDQKSDDQEYDPDTNLASNHSCWSAFLKALCYIFSFSYCFYTQDQYDTATHEHYLDYNGELYEKNPN